jgi:uncharacterized protein YdeI (YjbR/CyaY-like superfamily)
MQMLKTLHVTDREAWRAWLSEHYAEEKEVWLIFSRVHTGEPNIPYEDAVEEALCFGWIDSIIQRLSDEQYARKFTPRTNHQKWSDTNKRRVAELIAEGRMTPAGMAKLDYPHPESTPADAPAPRPRIEDLMLPEMEVALRTNPAAGEYWNSLPPSHQRRYLGWITSAKREETCRRRVEEAIGLLAQKKPLEGK